ncbi:uncharacterized protein LOC144169055 [Haemaphysalis longicornis]
MNILASVAIIGLYTFSLNPSAAFAGPKNALQRETPDVFKLFEIFDYVVAIFDQDGDGDLDCLTNVRTYLNQDIPYSTYVWMLKDHDGKNRKNVTMHMFAGRSKDESVFFMDDNPKKNVAKFIYTDYKECVVMTVPYNDIEQCMLWVTDEVKSNIPEHCIEQYDDICPVPSWVFDEETCGAKE